MDSGQIQALAAAFLVAVNAGWVALRGPELWRRYLPGEAPNNLSAVWATALLGATAVYAGFSAGNPMPGGWGLAGPIGVLPPVGVSLVSLGWLAILIDHRTQRLPDPVTALMALEVLSAVVLAPLAVPVAESWFWVAASSALIWVAPAAVGYCLGQVGLGDVKISPVLGVALGTCSLVVATMTLALAYVAAAVHAGLRLSKRSPAGYPRRFALGPYLVGSAIAGWTLVALRTALTTGA